MLLGASLGLDPEMLATILNTSVRFVLFRDLFYTILTLLYSI